MGDVLVLGGTAWLGREIASRAVGAGHTVTCLARGTSGTPAPGVTVVRADRDEPDAYADVLGTDWDHVVDVSWQPGQVGSAVDALADRARLWTYVSSGSVYDAPAEGDDEGAPVVPAWTERAATIEEYAGAKVRCEDLVRDALEDRALIARAGLLVGPGDGSDRFGYWVGRLALAGDGPVLVPDVPGLPVQVLDARDLADWIVAAPELGATGVVDAVGPRLDFATLIDAAARIAGFTGRLVAADPAWLEAQGVRHWAGPRSLPLWLPGDLVGMMARSGDRARAAGLTSRPLERVLVDTLVDERLRGLGRERRAGLQRDEELALTSRMS
jgi:nucleoside-diphosphate-sugar epimerase